MKTEIYIVRVKKPDNVSIPDMKAYIHNALTSFKGGLHRDSPYRKFKVVSIKSTGGKCNGPKIL